MKPAPFRTDQAPALTPGGPVVYCFSFRMRAGGELKEIMQAATMLERPITVTSLKLSVNMDSLASDLITILDWYDVQIYAGHLLRFNAPLYCIPIQGLHVPEAIRPAPMNPHRRLVAESLWSEDGGFSVFMVGLEFNQRSSGLSKTASATP